MPDAGQPRRDVRRVVLEQQPDAGRGDQQRERRQHVPDGEDRARHRRRSARQLEDLEVDLRRGVEVDPPQRGREDHRRDERASSRRRRDVAVHRRLPRLDDDLAEQDDEEEAEALGEVVRVERLPPGRRGRAPTGRDPGARGASRRGPRRASRRTRRRCRSPTAT